MGLNAFFAFVVAAQAGWQAALGAVFLSGIVFLILAWTGIVELMDEAVPATLKRAVSVGIGLFITLIGLTSAGIIVANPATVVGLGDLASPGPALALIGLAVISILMAKGVRGAMLIGILITTIIGIPMGVTKYQGIVGMPASLAPIMFKLDIRGALELGFITIFAFLFVDVIDTMGTMMCTAARAKLLDEQGRLHRIKEAMLVDAIGTMAERLGRARSQPMWKAARGSPREDGQASVQSPSESCSSCPCSSPRWR